MLDNLECIFKIPALMEELANIIILLDDTRFAKYNTTFLIVGVPNGVLEYFSKTDHLESVSNRIREIEKVGSLKPGESEQIIQEGFRQLDIKVNTAADMKFVTTHIHNVTLGIAQKVHEYCEILAELIEEKKWVFSPNLVPLADILWLRGGLRKCYTVIEGNMNSRETTVARKNQVIFAIGKINRSTFDAAAIEKFIIQQFPSNVAVNMGIGKILSDLSKSASPLLVHNSRTNEYSVVDPQYLMCIRIMLYISQTTLKLEKRGFDV